MNRIGSRYLGLSTFSPATPTTTFLIAAAICIVTSATASAQPGDGSFFRPGDRIAVIGNTLADRMQHDGWLETLLQCRLPEHQLILRHLGFSGDELTLRLRSRDFGSPDQWLEKVRADVVLACFGYNESYGGQANLERFRQDLNNFIHHTLQQRYNGQQAPRLVLISPIAHENLNDPNLPDGAANNLRIGLYAHAMRDVAAERQIAFVDLFAPSLQAYAQGGPYTDNGVHLNEQGNRLVAQLIAGQLAPGKDPPEERLKAVQTAVRDKNFYWFNRYRTTDGYSIYGERADLAFVDGQTNRVVAQREMEVLDVMTDNRDPAIWAAVRGELLKVDDTNAPPFVPVATNKPGSLPDGRHEFLDAQGAIEQMTLADGLRVELVASEQMFPELASPVQMSFDTKGRLWVATWPTYPHWKPKDPMNDKLLILEDLDGDGRADRCKVFADNLHNPTGFEFWGGGVLVAMAPDLLFLKDTDGDDVADVRVRVLHGLDSADTHHTANSFVFGPGGELYFQEGTFHHTQVETPYKPATRVANGAVFRFEPRTRKFEVYVSYGFANPHGHVFDRWGQDIVHDGTDSAPYHGALFSGRLDFPDKHNPPPQVYQQRTRPCPATEYVAGNHFPESMRGNLLVGNVIGFQGILQYRVARRDASYSAEELEPVLFSSDLNFRPVDMEFGPDGALYFVDWQNPIIGHMQHNLRDPSRDNVHGRVYRIVHQHRPLQTAPAVAGQPIEALLELLKSTDDRLRYRTRMELSDRQTSEVVAATRQWVASLSEADPDKQHHLLEALWLFQQHNVVDEPMLQTMLSSPEPLARAAATRVVCAWRDQLKDPLALLAQQAIDEDPLVRLEAVRACSYFDDHRAVEAALEALRHPTDRYLDYVMNETFRQLGPIWRKALADDVPLSANNPAGIDYLLRSVSNSELVKLPPTSNVHQALLTRPNILHEHRHHALMALAEMNGTSMMTELLASMHRVDASDDPDARLVLFDLAHLITMLPPEEFAKYREPLNELARSARRPETRRVALVTMITADGELGRVWTPALQSISSMQDLLEAIPLLPTAELRGLAHPMVATMLDAPPEPLASLLAGKPATVGRYVRLSLPRKGTLTLAEVEVNSGGVNVAPNGAARQSTTAHGGEARRAIDGNRRGAYARGGQTHTQEDEDQPWWELDLQSDIPIESIRVWNRQDESLGKRLDGFVLEVLDGGRRAVFELRDIPAPDRSFAIELGGDPASALQRATIEALASTGVDQSTTFARLAALIQEGRHRSAAIRALGRLPRASWPAENVASLTENILANLRETPANERTTPEALDELALGNRLTVALPRDEATRVRKALSELGVNVIRLRPVPHRMIYDRAQLFVEAGRAVEIVFENIDIMPHNVVIVQPGTMAAVGMAAEAMATRPDAFDKQFVPDMPEVVVATKLVQAGQTDRITFHAPATIGDYQFVCTYPGHWRRMYGTLHVVDNLEDVPPEALAPTADPEIQTRPFVRSWALDDLRGDLDSANGERDFHRAERLFAEVSCLQCHSVNQKGGQVGPDLTAVKEKLAKGDFNRLDVLREMLEPSAKIEEKYRTRVIIDTDGRVLTGIVAQRTEDSIKLLANPLDQKEPITLTLDQIEEESESNISLMPMGLLNTLTKDEILDLLIYIESAGDPKHPAFKPSSGHQH